MSYERLLLTYAYSNKTISGWLAFQHKNFDNIQEPRDIAKNFDAKIISNELKQIMDYNNFHCQNAHHHNVKYGRHNEV